MIDYKNLNDLPTDIKLAIANGQALVDQTRELMKEKTYDIDMTGKFQLKDDCKAVEKKIKLFAKGKATEKDVKDLEVAMIRLKTSAGALLGLK